MHQDAYSTGGGHCKGLCLSGMTVSNAGPLPVGLFNSRYQTKIRGKIKVTVPPKACDDISSTFPTVLCVPTSSTAAVGVGQASGSPALPAFGSRYRARQI